MAANSNFQLPGAAAIASGVLWAASFPKIGLAGLAWIAPGLMLFSALGRGGGEAFRLGYVAGLAHYLISLYWLLHIPFPVGAVAGWLSLSGYLALYPAVWVWLGWKLFPRKSSHDARLRPFSSAQALLSLSWGQRLRWTLSCAVVWVALEMVVGRFLTGFPWNLLGVSQYEMLPLIQLASVTGIYGLSFLVVWFSVSFANTVFILVRQPTRSWAWKGAIALPMLTLAVVIAFGFRRAMHGPRSDRELRVALVQPSIPQTLIWDANESDNRFKQLLQLSEQALASKPDLLVWPEAALPNTDQEMYRAITNLVVSHNVWMIFGADDAQTVVESSQPVGTNYFNSSFLLNPRGEIAGIYRKRRLVIFGEYVPLSRWLPFTKYLTPITGGFTPGDRPVPFQLSKPRATTSVLICFEDVFPHLAREYVTDDTDFLLNLTNNGWFGESAAQWQHAAAAVFRAVENGLPLVRCANNGLTCWVDSAGRLHEVNFRDSKDIYRAGFKIAAIPLLPDGQKRQATLYQRFGDWFGWGCVALASLMF
ncbi:MAG: apolipoprotein N-acyltransferase, partial [Verrucomicrobiota bacterium]